MIFLGAERLGFSIWSDSYAPERVQINDTRLHFHIGVKYANGWKYSSLVGPTDEDIIQTVSDIQQLIDEGVKEVGTTLTLEVKSAW